MRTPKKWRQLSAALLITGAELVPDEITRRLGKEPDLARSPGAEPTFRDGAGCWALTWTAADLSGLLDGLLPRVSPLATELAALRTDGYRVQLDIAGLVESGAHLVLSPEQLSRVAQLGLPLSFTTTSVRARSWEDLMGWNEPSHSHSDDS